MQVWLYRYVVTETTLTCIVSVSQRPNGEYEATVFYGYTPDYEPRFRVCISNESERDAIQQAEQWIEDQIFTPWHEPVPFVNETISG